MPASPASQSNNSPNLANNVELLQQRIGELSRLQSAARSQFFVTSLVIIAMFALFVIALYTRLRNNFDQANIQAAVSARSSQVLPIARELIIDSARQAAPAYRDAFRAALRQQGPQLANETLARFQAVPEENGKLMQSKLQTAFENALNRVQPELASAFPSLSDEQRQRLAQEFLMTQIEQQNQRVAARCNQLFTNDLLQLHAVLEKFELPDAASPQDRKDIERHFLKTTVALLDHQIESAYADPDDTQDIGIATTALRPQPQTNETQADASGN